MPLPPVARAGERRGERALAPALHARQARVQTLLLLSHLEQYVADLAAAGFEDVEFEDVTAEWAPFVSSRAAAFIAASERNTRVHGAVVAAELERFYATVDGLFGSGALGGVRITATKRAA